MGGVCHVGPGGTGITGKPDAAIYGAANCGIQISCIRRISKQVEPRTGWKHTGTVVGNEREVGAGIGAAVDAGVRAATDRHQDRCPARRYGRDIPPREVDGS